MYNVKTTFSWYADCYFCVNCWSPPWRSCACCACGSSCWGPAGSRCPDRTATLRQTGRRLFLRKKIYNNFSDIVLKTPWIQCQICSANSFFKGLVAILLPLFLLIFILVHTFIVTFIQYNHQSSFAEAFLHFLLCFFSLRGKPPWGAKPRFELGPALQQATRHPIEPRCTLLSHAAPYWATLHPIEPRCTLLSYAPSTNS